MYMLLRKSLVVAAVVAVEQGFSLAREISGGSPATVRRRSIVSNLIVVGKRIARL